MNAINLQLFQNAILFCTLVYFCCNTTAVIFFLQYNDLPCLNLHFEDWNKYLFCTNPSRLFEKWISLAKSIVTWLCGNETALYTWKQCAFSADALPISYYMLCLEPQQRRYWCHLRYYRLQAWTAFWAGVTWYL